MRTAISRIALSVATQTAAVIAHEAGHYVAARAYGLNPRVTFSGSTARTLYDSGATPSQNVTITLAGPAAQAATIILLAREKSLSVSCMVAIASLARNFAPIPSSDGHRLCGDSPDSVALRNTAYWATSAAALALGCWKKDGWSLFAQLSNYDLYVGRARRWAEQEAFQRRVKLTGFEL